MSERFLFIMSKIHNKITSHIKKELKKEGLVLSPGQMGILLALDREGQTTMGELSGLLDIDNAAITRLVDKLEKLGLVERKINLEDRRQMLIFITDEGTANASVVKTVAQSANSKIKEGFTIEEMEVYERVNLAILKKFG